MALTQNGVTITEFKGQFSHECYRSEILHRDMVHWDYRDTQGKLYSGIAKTVEDAKKAASEKSGETI